MATYIYHNPRCSKSRQTLDLLQQHGIEPTIIDYLNTPLTADQLKQVLNYLGCSARSLLRTKESCYTQLGLGANSLSDDQLIEAMLRHPILIERPIVVHNNRAIIGRPPEKVLEIIK